MRLAALADAINNRLQQTWQISDADERIDLHREAISVLFCALSDQEAMPPTRPEILPPAPDAADWLFVSWSTLTTRSRRIVDAICQQQIDLCHALQDRFKFCGKVEDVEEQIAVAGVLVDRLPDGHRLRSQALLALGIGLHLRWDGMRDEQALSNALDACRKASEVCHSIDHACDACLCSLGSCLTWCSMIFGNDEFLSEALGILQYVSHMLPEGHPNRPKFFIALGTAIIRRCDMLGDFGDSNLGEHYLRTALSLLPRCHPEWSKTVQILSTKYDVSFQKTGDVGELHRSICCRYEILHLQHMTRLERAQTLRRLAITLKLRFYHLGTEHDLDRAIVFSQESLDLLVPGHATRGAVLETLAGCLESKFELCGDISFCERAIRLFREALQLSMHRGQMRVIVTHNLASALFIHYKYTGEPGILAESLVHLRWAHDQILPRAMRGVVVTNLGEALQQQFEDFGDLLSLEEAVTIYKDWIDQENTGFYDQGRLLHQYAASLYRSPRQMSESTSNIDEAIHQYRAALLFRPPGHHQRFQTLFELSATLATRFELWGDVEDAATAFDLQKEALTILPPSHPRRAHGVFGLSRLYLLQHSLVSDYSQATRLTISALEDKNCHPQSRLAEALVTLQKFEEIVEANYDNGLLDAYRLTISLLPRVAFFGLNLQSRLRVLAKAGELPSAAAVRAVQMGHVETALEILEEGRAVFWAQFLRLRTQFDDLPEGISQQLKGVSEQLQHWAIRGTQDFSVNDHAAKARLEADAARMRLLSDEFEMLISTARCHPGHERFLMPRNFSSLAGATDGAPIVIFLASQNRCLAIILRGHGLAPSAVDLGQISWAELGRLAVSTRQANLYGRDVLTNRAMQVRSTNDSNQNLRALWERVMQPIFNALGWQVSELA